MWRGERCVTNAYQTSVCDFDMFTIQGHEAGDKLQWQFSLCDMPFCTKKFFFSSGRNMHCVLMQGQSDVNFHFASCSCRLYPLKHMFVILFVYTSMRAVPTTSGLCVHTMSGRGWACLCFTSCRVQSLIPFWWHSLITSCCRFHRFC